METLEHIPPQAVDPYLAELAKATKGYLFVTVPNELGILFLCKHLVKRCFKNAHHYTFSELVNQTLGNTEKVKRNEHKGFNYKSLISQISDHFEIVEVSGNPLAFMPTSLNFGVGIIAKASTRHKRLRAV